MIGAQVELGDGVVVGPFAVIGGTTRLGDRTWIGAGAVIGAPPEIRGHLLDEWVDQHRLGVVVGSDSVIREAAQIHGGSQAPTVIGAGAYIMNQAYVAHDCLIADDVTISSSVTLAGHVTIGRAANLGMGATVHQRRIIGALAMVGMGAVVTRDLPAFMVAHGVPARVRAVNVIGMERAGLGAEAREWASAALRGEATAPPSELEAWL